MRLVLALILSLVGPGMAPPVTLASHLEGLRSAGEGFRVSPLGLIILGLVTFVVLGFLIVLGLRYLERLRED